MAIKKWTYDDGMLYHGDCLKVLKHLPEKSVDLVVGSPPYEQARLYLEDGKDLGIARDTEEWVAWMVEIFRASLRVCTGLVAFVLAGQTKNYRWTASPALLMADLHRKGFNLRTPALFQRVGIPGSGGPDWLRNDYEFIVCVTPPGKLPWSDNTACGEAPKWRVGGSMSYRAADGKRKSTTRSTGSFEYKTGRRDPKGKRQSGVYNPPDKANPGNIIHVPVGGGLLGADLAHENEAPFPERLVRFFIKSFCKPGGTVLDPFSGSGTTVGEAVKLGRRFVGVDLRLSQIKLTQRRLKQARLNKGFGF